MAALTVSHGFQAFLQTLIIYFKPGSCRKLYYKKCELQGKGCLFMKSPSGKLLSFTTQTENSLCGVENNLIFLINI